MTYVAQSSAKAQNKEVVTGSQLCSKLTIKRAIFYKEMLPVHLRDDILNKWIISHVCIMCSPPGTAT